MTWPEIYVCDGVRTPIGRYAGALASVRPDDLAALVLQRLRERNPKVDWSRVDDVVLGCTNQAGEDSRNVARQAALLAGLGENAPGVTVNRLCGSGMDAISQAARAIAAGEAELVVAGGVESMSRAPYAMAKPEHAFGRAPEMYDSTIGWRFVNPRMRDRFGVDSMIETAENLARECGISRTDQDLFACESQARARRAQASGRLAHEIVPVEIAGRKGAVTVVEHDEHPRDTDLESLGRLRPINGLGGSVTAGNAAGINDGAAALIVASAAATRQYALTPLARITGSAMAGLSPRIMGIGPVPASRKLLARLGLGLNDFDLIELNEAFAAQALAVTREWGLPDSAEHVNPNGGAIALGHPLGMSGARLVLTAATEIAISGRRRALCTMCIGVGQGIALALEQV